ncbi:unnamed protein product [Phytophthora fragariaefolia]|uniref:Unnamed protein product n=1 Tax=Phytophthora fragariaefolia TaxID=1490495 RepID=A0A9W6Y1Z5_9STRA|nr:unnamed protein product [Phytophthora fragariaefolia]
MQTLTNITVKIGGINRMSRTSARRRSADDDSLARITNDSQGAEYDDKSDESVYGVNGEDGVMNDRVDRRGRYRGDQRDDDGQDRSEAGEDSLDGKDDNRSSETDSED